MDAATAGFLIGLGSLAVFLFAVVLFQKAFGIPARSIECPSQDSYFFLCPHDNKH